MKTRLIVAVLCLLWPLSALAELTASFSLDKTTFVPGEPVFLTVKFVNTGPVPERVDAETIQEQPGCSGLGITLSSDDHNTPPGGCNMNGGPEEVLILLSGGVHISRFLLNFGHNISAPGQYSVDAAFLRNAKVRLSFRVLDDPTVWNRSDHQPYIGQLHSSDRQTRRDAAFALAYLATPSLEDVLLGLASDPELRRYAPLAFHQLNTPRSMRAMVALVQGPWTQESFEAARYLVETGDQRYFPILLEATRKYSSLCEYAAELGGEKMLPELVQLSRDPNINVSTYAVMSMGSTGSRAAIPLLLEFLNDANPKIVRSADYALRRLTHRTAEQDMRLQSTPEVMRAKWTTWRHAEGDTAPIYKFSETTHWVPLP